MTHFVPIACLSAAKLAFVMHKRRTIDKGVSCLESIICKQNIFYGIIIIINP